ncbi:AAA domain-containing protein [Ochrobactrum sp. EDr1-4]|uniref:AAA domain-containing protein n=1 Tax=Ochrobactrum sp. EDr1-4 TaxID=3368622 RepID=UPI003BA0155F
MGIVAFSQKQLKSIHDVVQKANLKELRFLGLPEGVQGKDTDCVLFFLNSVFTPEGRLPLEIEGFEDKQRIERMNVALTRARERTIIFSSLLASDIDRRLATDVQALIRSVLQTFEMLPSQKNGSRYGL